MTTPTYEPPPRPSEAALVYMQAWKAGIVGNSPDRGHCPTRLLGVCEEGWRDGVNAKQTRWAAAKACYPRAPTTEETPNE